MKSKIGYLIIVVIIGVILTYLYSHLVVSKPRERFKQYDKTVYLEGNKVVVDFDLPKDSYLFKLKHMIQENQLKDLIVNKTQVFPHSMRQRGIIETTYIYLPKKLMRAGKNLIEVSFSKEYSHEVTTNLSNYRKNIEDVIYILFPDSANIPTGKA